MQRLTFNVLTSKTVWGALLAALGYLAEPQVLAVLPGHVAKIVIAIGGVLAAIGLRDAATKPDEVAPPVIPPTAPPG